MAVIGGGPAGMTVAEELAVRGHSVTVYEMWPMPARRAVELLSP